VTTDSADFLDVSRLLAPRSIAVLGASDRAGSFGGDTVKRLVKFGFPGPVWPVNPSGAPVAGLTCYRSPAELPGVPDLAVLALPAGALLDSIRDLVAHGVKNGIAYAGGLGEAGGEGAELERRIAAFCRDAGFLLCGPNCVGIINTAVPVTASFATALHELDRLRPGTISMVSQSGGIGTTAFSIAEEAGFGFRCLVSSGNEAVVGFADYLHAFAEDEGTRVIAAYLEGVTDGPKLLRALEAARRRSKPVVMIKSGASGASARAALAHTGKLAGEDRVFDAVLREMGVIRVDSVEELIDVALVLAGTPPQRMPKGRGVGIVSFGGGSGVLATDQCVRSGLEVPALPADRIAQLKPLLASVATASNPMDLTPSTAFRDEALTRLPQALDMLADEPAVHSLMFIVSSMAAKAPEIAAVIEELWRRSAKPVIACWPSPPTGTIERLAEAGIRCFDEPARGARVLGRLAGLAAVMSAAPGRRPEPLAFDWAAHAATGDASTVVTEDRCHAILAAAGLPAAAGRLARSEAEAAAAYATLGPAVALKGISPAVTHRAAAGLLALGLVSEDDVRRAYRALAERAAAQAIALDGLLVQRMAAGGEELIVSALRDRDFGLMISVGAGGGLAELIDDIIIRRGPVDEQAAAAMIEALRVVRHRRGHGGAPAAEPAAAFVSRFSRLMASAPWDRFVFEVNPLRWTSEAAIAVDGLLIVG
jgi:acyl-CoA synthetase (NDP forming)